MTRIRRGIRGRLAAVAGAAAAAAILVGCTAEPTTPPIPDTTATEPPSPVEATSAYFEGTVEERSALLQGCLEDDGWVIRGGDHGEFAIDMTGRTDEELIEAREACEDQVGHPQYAGLSQAQLKERYAGRIEQFDCLVEAGLLEGDPMSFEMFVEDYERNGQRMLWSPALDVDRGLAQQGALGPSQMCPVGGSGW